MHDFPVDQTMHDLPVDSGSSSPTPALGYGITHVPPPSASTRDSLELSQAAILREPTFTLEPVSRLEATHNPDLMYLLPRGAPTDPPAEGEDTFHRATSDTKFSPPPTASSSAPPSPEAAWSITAEPNTPGSINVGHEVPPSVVTNSQAEAEAAKRAVIVSKPTQNCCPYSDECQFRVDNDVYHLLVPKSVVANAAFGFLLGSFSFLVLYALSYSPRAALVGSMPLGLALIFFFGIPV